MISSRSTSLFDLLKLGHFIPAQVQREFQWKTEQTSQLLDDIFGAFQRTGADPGDTSTSDDTDNREGEGEEEPGLTALDAGKISGARSARPTRSTPNEYFLGS